LCRNDRRAQQRNNIRIAPWQGLRNVKASPPVLLAAKEIWWIVCIVGKQPNLSHSMLRDRKELGHSVSRINRLSRHPPSYFIDHGYAAITWETRPRHESSQYKEFIMMGQGGALL
jgi:hypothetical protein